MSLGPNSVVMSAAQTGAALSTQGSTCPQAVPQPLVPSCLPPIAQSKTQVTVDSCPSLVPHVQWPTAPTGPALRTHPESEDFSTATVTFESLLDLCSWSPCSHPHVHTEQVEGVFQVPERSRPLTQRNQSSSNNIQGTIWSDAPALTALSPGPSPPPPLQPCRVPRMYLHSSGKRLPQASALLSALRASPRPQGPLPYLRVPFRPQPPSPAIWSLL